MSIVFFNLCFWQIYVEIERARLTRMLAKIKEDQGDIAGGVTVYTDFSWIMLLYLL